MPVLPVTNLLHDFEFFRSFCLSELFRQYFWSPDIFLCPQPQLSKS